MQAIEIHADATGLSTGAIGSFHRLPAPPARAPWHGTIVRVILDTAARGRRQAYRVLDASTGEVLVERSRDPEHDVARVLDERGHVGMMETQWRGSSTVAMRLDIATASRRCILETSSVGPVAAPWRPFNADGRLPSSGRTNGGDFAPSASVGASQ